MMPGADTTAASLVLSTIVLLIAALLAWRERRDRCDRTIGLSPDDELHFARQDLRRSAGIAILVLLAAGLVIGSRLPPRLENRTNPQFAGTWLAVLLLILALLCLAMIDWVALGRYARRKRREMFRERIEILKEESRQKRDVGDGNGHAGGPIKDLFP